MPPVKRWCNREHIFAHTQRKKNLTIDVQHHVVVLLLPPPTKPTYSLKSYENYNLIKPNKPFAIKCYAERVSVQSIKFYARKRSRARAQIQTGYAADDLDVCKMRIHSFVSSQENVNSTRNFNYFIPCEIQECANAYMNRCIQHFRCSIYYVFYLLRWLSFDLAGRTNGQSMHSFSAIFRPSSFINIKKCFTMICSLVVRWSEYTCLCRFAFALERVRDNLRVSARATCMEVRSTVSTADAVLTILCYYMNNRTAAADAAASLFVSFFLIRSAK